MLLLILCLVINAAIFGQELNTPSWLIGTWNNQFESNSDAFDTWNFSNDSISYIKGYPLDKERRTYLSQQYSDYTTKSEASDSVFRIDFIKENGTVTYEFQLQTVDGLKDAILTYSIEINGEMKREHALYSNAMFMRKLE